MWEQLIKKIQSIIDSNTNISQSYNYERSEFGGFPAVTITPAANNSEYETTTENRRIYAFDLRIWIQRKMNVIGDDEADRIMRKTVDSVMDSLDSAYTLSGVEQRTGYTMLFMEAIPSGWGYGGREMEYRVSEIKIRVHTSVDVNII